MFCLQISFKTLPISQYESFYSLNHCLIRELKIRSSHDLFLKAQTLFNLLEHITEHKPTLKAPEDHDLTEYHEVNLNITSLHYPLACPFIPLPIDLRSLLFFVNER